MSTKKKPSKKPDAVDRKARLDGWGSALSGLGYAGRDKRLTATYTGSDRLSRDEAETLWRGSDMAARIVETWPGEMMREGFQLTIQTDEGKDELSTASGLDEEVDTSEETSDENGAEKPDDEVETGAPKRDGFPFGKDGGGGAQPPGGGLVLPPPPTAPPGVIERKNEDGREMAEALMAQWEELKGLDRFTEALEYARAYGGAGIILGADDGSSNLRKPLNEDNIKSVKWLNVLTRTELYPISYYNDPMAPKYGEPEVYRIQPDSTTWNSEKPTPEAMSKMVEIHESRLILFYGNRTSRRHVLNEQGWGDSVFVRVQDVLRDFDMSWAGAGILLHDFAQAIFKIKGLAEAMAGNEDDLIRERIQMLDYGRSVARAAVLDAEEDFERKTTNMTGYPEMLEKFSLRLAAAADMPVSLLMGQAPAGLNATGDSDIRFFYDRVKARQNKVLKPALERLFRLMMLAKEGPCEGVEPEQWSIKFNPLWQQTDKEQADTRLAVANTDKIYIDAGVLTPEEVAASRFGGDEYSMETFIDFEGRQEMEQTFEEEKIAHQEEKTKAMEEAVKAEPAKGEPAEAAEEKPEGNPFAK